MESGNSSPEKSIVHHNPRAKLLDPATRRKLQRDYIVVDTHIHDRYLVVATEEEAFHLELVGEHFVRCEYPDDCPGPFLRVSPVFNGHAIVTFFNEETRNVDMEEKTVAPAKKNPPNLIRRKAGRIFPAIA